MPVSLLVLAALPVGGVLAVSRDARRTPRRAAAAPSR
jgi:hypothetical protein